jgi:hypothetical protein
MLGISPDSRFASKKREGLRVKELQTGVRRQIQKLTVDLLMAITSSFIRRVGSTHISILGIISLLIPNQLKGKRSIRLVR